VISGLVGAHLCIQPAGPSLPLCGRFLSKTKTTTKKKVNAAEPRENAVKIHKCPHIQQSW